MAYVFVAPKIIGGSDSVPAVGGRGAARVAEALEMRGTAVKQIGSDVLLCGTLSSWEYDREPILTDAEAALP
jgi:riboflavin biosynthesis pyrimidine reductase